MRWIERDEDFDTVLLALQGATTFFVDTEFESTRRQTRLSVIQVSCGAEPFLLDALKLTRLRELGEVMVRDGVTWVLHAGLQDVELLLECFRKPKPPELFDTQIAWALLGPEANVSLAYLLFRLLGLRTMKTHQTDDWIQRPLPTAQLEYAAADIEHLPQLYTLLSEQLVAAERREVVTQLCHEMLWPKPDLPAPLSLSSFRNAWQLRPKNQAALRYLIQWYNELPAWERDRVPQAKTLLSIASRLPRNAKDLMRMKGMPPTFNQGYADTITRGLNRAAQEAVASEFVQIDPEPYATFREIRLDAWLGALRADVSAAVGIAPELAFPARILKGVRDLSLSRGDCTAVTTELSDWRARLLAAAVAAYVARTPNPLA
jgi:ribonuclease D